MHKYVSAYSAIKELVRALAERSSYGCTWEVWRALKKLELLSAAPRVTLTLLSLLERLLLNLLLAQNRGIRLATLLLLLKKNCIVEISIILSELELHENFLFL